MLKASGVLDWAYRNAYRCAWALILAYRMVFRPRVIGAYVAVWHGDRLLVIKNPHKPYFTVPCGFVHRGERPIVAAARELGEEVAIHLDSDRLQSAGVFETDEDYALDIGHVFEIRLPERPVVQPDRREVLSAEFLTQGEIEALRMCEIVRQYLEARQT